MQDGKTNKPTETPPYLVTLNYSKVGLVTLVFQTNYNYFVNGQAVPSQNHNHEPELRQNTEMTWVYSMEDWTSFVSTTVPCPMLKLNYSINLSSHPLFLAVSSMPPWAQTSALAWRRTTGRQPSWRKAYPGLSLNTTTGQITGTLSQPGYHRVFVKAMNEHGTGSDTIAIVARPQTDQHGWPVDIPDGSDSQNGLVLWLDANSVDADENRLRHRLPQARQLGGQGRYGSQRYPSHRHEPT